MRRANGLPTTCLCSPETNGDVPVDGSPFVVFVRPAAAAREAGRPSVAGAHTSAVAYVWHMLGEDP